jgi:hypothetical protein
VLTRLVREFFANLEVVENDDNGIIGVPVLQIFASPYNEVVLPPSLDELLKFFHVVPQGEE